MTKWHFAYGSLLSRLSPEKIARGEQVPAVLRGYARVWAGFEAEDFQWKKRYISQRSFQFHDHAAWLNLVDAPSSSEVAGYLFQPDPAQENALHSRENVYLRQDVTACVEPLSSGSFQIDAVYTYLAPHAMRAGSSSIASMDYWNMILSGLFKVERDVPGFKERVLGSLPPPPCRLGSLWLSSLSASRASIAILDESTERFYSCPIRGRVEEIHPEFELFQTYEKGGRIGEYLASRFLLPNPLPGTSRRARDEVIIRTERQFLSKLASIAPEKRIIRAGWKFAD